MMVRKIILFLCFIWLLFGSFGSNILSAAILESIFPSINCIGMTVNLGTDDAELNATATIRYKSNDGPWREGFPLSRIPYEHKLTGSLFWLDPATRYDFEITINDSGDTLDGQILAGHATTRQEITIPIVTKSYYVSPTGDGTVCSNLYPCALETALGIVNAGEEVVLLSGTYYYGDEITDFALKNSGENGSPIVIRGEQKQATILDGSDLASNSLEWSYVNNGIYKATPPLQLDRESLVVVGNKRLYPYGSYTDLDNLKYGISGFYYDSSILYIHMVDNSNISNQDVKISKKKRGLVVYRKNYIYFLNITFQYYGYEHRGQSLRFVYSNNCLVNNCNFIMNDISIDIAGSSSNNLFQNNHFVESVYGWVWEAVKNEEEYEGIKDIESGALFFERKDDENVTNQVNNIIRDNIIEGFFDGIHLCNFKDETHVVSNTDIYRNNFYEIADDAIEADGNAQNVRIWGNIFKNNFKGISFAPLYNGPAFLLRNLFQQYIQYTLDTAGKVTYPIAFGIDEEKRYGDIVICHNTFDGNYAIPYSIGILVPERDFRFSRLFSRNNIYVSTRKALNKTNQDANSSFDMDYDNFYTPEGIEFAFWDKISYSSFNSFRGATGFEINGLNKNPCFNSDYTLSEDSPLINTGEIINGINNGFLGSAPDMGFQESPYTKTGNGCGDDGQEGGNGSGGGGGCFITPLLR